jgi:ketosteroid isomerase-like protein
VSFNEDLDRERAQTMRRVRQASDAWAGAMRAHKLAPPDAGFAARLSDLADAAGNEQVAWEHAHAAGLLWRPVPGAEHAAPPYELRPGTGRRGPTAQWERFDAAVAALNRAITGSSAAAVADAFGDFAIVAGELSAAIAREDGDAATVPTARRRGAA